jgi:hypothetical protein
MDLPADVSVIVNLTPEHAAEIIYRYVTEKETRLARGLRLREAMRQQLERGETPTGYRADWLRAAVTKVINTLVEEADGFNRVYADDLISAHDLVDVLVTARSRLMKKIKGE